MARALAVQNITIITYTEHKTEKINTETTKLSAYLEQAGMKMYTVVHVVQLQSMKKDQCVEPDPDSIRSVDPDPDLGGQK
jgi:hypothetical protein